MIELVYNYVSLEGIALSILIVLIFSLYSRNKVEITIMKKLEELQKSIDETTIENQNLSLALESVRSSVSEIENMVTPSHKKIAVLLKQGFPEDVAADLVLSDELE